MVMVMVMVMEMDWVEKEAQVANGILIVDDDPGTLTLVSVMLERGGFNVYKAKDAFEALDLLESITPELFVVDVMMPGMDGIELCARIRERPETHHTPVIMLTAHGNPELSQSAEAAGANAYLTKPILWHDMVSKVKSMLQRSTYVSAG